jgi:hypothetical protein
MGGRATGPPDAGAPAGPGGRAGARGRAGRYCTRRSLISCATLWKIAWSSAEVGAW